MSDQNALSAPPADRPVVEEVVEYETGWVTAGYDLVGQPDGTTKRYYWARLPPAAVVVAVHGDDLLLVEQYRPTVRETQLELPAGVVEDGETFLEAGVRELREETGFAAGDAELLADFWTSTGLLRHRRGVVLATDLHDAGEVAHDSNEFLVPRSVPTDEALSVARTDPTNDATLEGVLLAREAGVL